jgi:hypothetical protein
MTTILACICGKYDESQDLANDFKVNYGLSKIHVVLFCFDF